MALLVDVVILIFICTIFLKFNKTQKQNLEIQKQIKEIREDLNLTMLNPQQARRTLKQRRK